MKLQIHTISITVRVLIAYLIILNLSCAPKTTPYANGPVMSKKNIRKTFRPIVQFMDVRPRMTFADVGAGSGVFSVMMATFMDSCNIYIQDIDTLTLRQSNLDKIIDFYSKQNNRNLRSNNNFRLTIGNETYTNLPDKTFDRIWMNGAIHIFNHVDSMIIDLAKKMKPDGVLFIRETFKKNHEEVVYCSAECRRPLVAIDDFIAIMRRNGFNLVKQVPDMSGSPVFAFALVK